MALPNVVTDKRYLEKLGWRTDEDAFTASYIGPKDIKVWCAKSIRTLYVPKTINVSMLDVINCTTQYGDYVKVVQGLSKAYLEAGYTVKRYARLP